MAGKDPEMLKVLKQIAKDVRWLRNQVEHVEKQRGQASEKASKAIRQTAKESDG